jgi:TRAP-type uncharacterized transport system substrate-binding protein
MKKSIKALKSVRTIEDLRSAQRKELVWLLIPLLLLVAVGFWITSRFVQPPLPRFVTMSTGGELGGYHAFGKRYQALLAKKGFKLELKTSAGAIENLARLKAATADLALVQGGIATPEQAETLISLGRLFLEPLWVFYSGKETYGRLSELRGKKLAVGSPGSGTWQLATTLLAANKIDETNSTLLPLSGQQAADALTRGEIDASFLALAPQAPIIQTMLRDPSLKLMSFVQADAYTRLFPYLAKATLNRGAIDLVADIPSRDIDLVAPVAALVARPDLHPAVIGLLVEAAKDVHSGGSLFNRPGEFPKADDPEFEFSSDAERVYKSGLSFLRRHLPFWLASLIERFVVLVVPVVTLALPLMKLIPALFRWRHRQRLLHWFAALKQLEARVAVDPDREDRDLQRQELARISKAVDEIPIPIGFTEQFYSLRAAIDLVRSRIG